MHPLACVAFPNVALQLHHRHRASSGPLAIVTSALPTGELLELNLAACQAGLRKGMRLSEALSICSTLDPKVADLCAVERFTQEVRECLQHFSPGVYHAVNHPGLFWIDAKGLTQLFENLHLWGTQVHHTLKNKGLSARISVGLSRFGTWAAVRSCTSVQNPVIIFDDAKQERTATLSTHLNRFYVSPADQVTLNRLAVVTIGDLTSLAATSVRQRFGDSVVRLYDYACGHATPTVCTTAPTKDVSIRVDLDSPETHLDRLLFGIKNAIHRLTSKVNQHHQRVHKLDLWLEYDHSQKWTHASVCPAQSTVDDTILIDLIRIKLETLQFERPIVGFVLRGHGVCTSNGTQSTLIDRPQRDLDGARTVIARVQAELGQDAVKVAVLDDAHLPEHNHHFEPMKHLTFQRNHDVSQLPVVRRIFPRSISNKCQRWAPLGQRCGHTLHQSRPYVLTGGWWDKPYDRAYQFLVCESGAILWIYQDRLDGTWHMIGTVE